MNDQLYTNKREYKILPWNGNIKGNVRKIKLF